MCIALENATTNLTIHNGVSQDIFVIFRGLDKDIEGSAKRWKKFTESEQPEREKFPQEWKNKTGLQKLCMMRALRPDRMTHAIRYFYMFL